MRIDRKKRISLKKAAIANLRGHYAMFLVMCVFASFVGAEFVTSENFVATRTTPVERLVSGYQDEIIETEHRVESFTGASALSDKIKGILDGIKLDDEKTNEIFSRSTGWYPKRSAWRMAVCTASSVVSFWSRISSSLIIA